MCAADKISPPNKENDDGVIFRKYLPQDLPYVQAMFREGMEILIPEMTRITTRNHLTTLAWNHPLILTAPLLGWGWHAQRMESYLFWVLYTAAIVLAHVALYKYLSFKSRQVFREYIQHSLETDLADIPSVYAKHGGCFLVAATTGDDDYKVIGMVGGEFKETLPNGKGVYELRRMSIDAKARGRGLGKRIIQALEKELHGNNNNNNNHGMAKLFLSCSNLQYPAHALYSGQGFQFKGANSYPGAPQGFAIWNYEKEY